MEETFWESASSPLSALSAQSQAEDRHSTLRRLLVSLSAQVGIPSENNVNLLPTTRDILRISIHVPWVPCLPKVRLRIVTLQGCYPLFSAHVGIPSKNNVNLLPTSKRHSENWHPVPGECLVCPKSGRGSSLFTRIVYLLFSAQVGRTFWESAPLLPRDYRIDYQQPVSHECLVCPKSGPRIVTLKRLQVSFSSLLKGPFWVPAASPQECLVCPKSGPRIVTLQGCKDRSHLY